ncbi:MAG: hypothetical protein LBE56_03140 [Tannerella sp.]|jgi:hypothetical protein|nr:hypothetical protein [Tannerella sp.]
MKTMLRIFCACTAILLTSACTNELDDFLLDENGKPVYNEHIKSVSSNNITVRKFRYDSSGKLIEDGSMMFYHKYSYGGDGNLKMVETAVDESMYSYHVDLNKPPRGEVMTAENSTITSTSSYNYDSRGRLSKIEHYNKKDGENFELTSIILFDYEGEHISRENIYDEKGNIAQYSDFEYDKNGNMTKERHFICIFEGTPENPKLTYEYTYTYDDYKNPYQVLNITGPSSYTGANNLLKITSVWYTDDPRTETATQSFVYNNNNGYPSKMKYDGGEEVYTY